MATSKLRSKVANPARPVNSVHVDAAKGSALDGALQALSRFIESEQRWFPNGLSRLKVEISTADGASAQLELEGRERGDTGHRTFAFDHPLSATFGLSKPLQYDEVVKLVAANNKSKNAAVTTELLVSLIWKESGFRSDANPGSSTATGLMQMTVAAVDDVNKNTPPGEHFEHAEMTDPAKNIQCGTYYLDLRIKRAGGKLKEGLEGYGTGSGYADNIIECAACLKKAANDPQDCLDKIHT